MNYYKYNESNRTMNDLIRHESAHPQLMLYHTFKDTQHEDLVRCKECGLKYDMHILRRVSVGKFICKYCLNREAK